MPPTRIGLKPTAQSVACQTAPSITSTNAPDYLDCIITSASSNPMRNMTPVYVASTNVPTRETESRMDVPHGIPTSQATAALQQITSKNTLCVSSNANVNSSMVHHPPTLAIAPPPTTVSKYVSNDNWYYVTRFQPHESEANVISYIAHHTNCDASQIVCHKLVRSNDDSRPISFLSFKINVPQNVEQIILSDGFWPTGVSITPFLDRRSNIRKPIGARLPFRSKPSTPTTKHFQNTYRVPPTMQTIHMPTPSLNRPPPTYRMQDSHRYQTSMIPQTSQPPQRISAQQLNTAISQIRTSLV